MAFPAPDAAPPLFQNVQKVLRWLALGKHEPKKRHFDALREHLLVLRAEALPTPHHIKLLELIHTRKEMMFEGVLPLLHHTSLPIPRRIRGLVQSVQAVLENLAQDYMGCLAELFDPDKKTPSQPPQITLHRSITALSQHIFLSYLLIAPAQPGIWQSLHGAYLNACRLGLQKQSATPDGPTIEQVYKRILLIACAQPASFNSLELIFMADYVRQLDNKAPLLTTPPKEQTSVFWIRPDFDRPPQAIARRQVAPSDTVFYFSCVAIADLTQHHLQAIMQGEHPSRLHLPEFTGTAAGQSTLRRLSQAWGIPAKRRFQRRRQTSRGDMCIGIQNAWYLLAHPEDPYCLNNLTHWMITNESAQGYGVMHVSGKVDQLHIGDIVLLRPQEGQATWQVCVVRCAYSENAEHIELGLQVLSPQAQPAKAILPELANTAYQGQLPILLFPALPPLRPSRSIVVPAGFINPQRGQFVLMIEGENLQFNDVKATSLDEQTGRIEVFSITP